MWGTGLTQRNRTQGGSKCDGALKERSEAVLVPDVRRGGGRRRLQLTLLRGTQGLQDRLGGDEVQGAFGEGKCV